MYDRISSYIDIVHPSSRTSSLLLLSNKIQTHWGTKGIVKEGLELTPMGSFDVGQGGVNSGPNSYGVLEGVR